MKFKPEKNSGFLGDSGTLLPRKSESIPPHPCFPDIDYVCLPAG